VFVAIAGIHFATALALTVVARVSWRYRTEPAGLPLFVTSSAASGMVLLNGLQFLTTDPSVLYWLFSSIGPLAMAASAAWFYIAVEYVGNRFWRAKRVVRAVAGVVTVDFLLLISSYAHRTYIIADLEVTPRGGTLVEFTTFGWFHLGVEVVFVLSGLSLFVVEFSKSRGVYRKQTAALILAGITPMPLFLFEMLGPEVGQEVSISVFGFALVSSLVLWAIFYADFFKTVPVAREILMEKMEDGVIALDADGVVVDANPEAQRIFDIDEEELGVQKEDVLGGYPELVTELDSGTGGTITLNHDGETRYYDLKKSSISDENLGVGAENSGHIVVIRDITEKELQRKKIERQNERLDKFTGMVSHDLRNPLNVAMARAEMAMDDEDLSHVGKVTEMLDRMDEMIDELLVLADSGGRIDHSELEPLRLQRVAEAAWENVGIEEEGEEASLNFEFDDEFVVKAKEDSLLHVFENLFKNSVGHNEAPVEVRIGEIDNGGFFVGDGGSGIPESDRKYVFKHGYTTSRGGAGFGLSIVKQIAEAHGWEVSVTDGRDGGARFNILVSPSK